MDSIGIAEPGAPAAAAAPETARSRQFVIFQVEGEMFALPLSEVQEIIRVPETVRVPLSPHSLRGLANLRGVVLPIMSLRSVFGFREGEDDDATRVVVLDRASPVGLMVDRMANVVTVEPERIEPADTIRASVDTEFLTGMIKGADGRSMVMILASGELVEREFLSLGQARPIEARDLVRAAPERAEDVGAPVEQDQLVSFEVAEQEYAFPIERVQEIVQLPSAITHVPNVAGHVIGVIMLRNRLLPLVSLREMLGLPFAPVSEVNKVVVVSLGQEGSSVGVVMDSVKEVLRVNRALVEPVPALFAGSQGSDEIQAICRLDGGRRLVSVLSVENLFRSSDLQKIIGESREATAMDNRSGNRTGAIVDEEQFVVFRLMDEEYGVRIDAVQEIVRVPDELTRIPRTPAFIEGVINLRGVVLPVIDQRRRFDLEGIERNDRQRIMVLTVGGVRTGFVVDSVSEVMRIPADCIGQAPSLSGEQQRLIRRVANLERQKRMILLLDVAELLSAGEIGQLAAA